MKDATHLSLPGLFHDQVFGFGFVMTVSFFRPASRNALSMSISICPFTLRNSSDAHFSNKL